jgi:Na+/melibiose symporter-like transporter
MGGAFSSLISLAILVAVFAGFWKMFEKAGKPGWAAIVPFYNIYVLLLIAGKPAWWLVLYLIPLVNIIIAIIVTIAIAKKFGKSGGFVVGLILLPVVFYPILGFGDARYQE